MYSCLCCEKSAWLPQMHSVNDAFLFYMTVALFCSRKQHNTIHPGQNTRQSLGQWNMGCLNGKWLHNCSYLETASLMYGVAFCLHATHVNSDDAEKKMNSISTLVVNMTPCMFQFPSTVDLYTFFYAFLMSKRSIFSLAWDGNVLVPTWWILRT